MTKLNIIRFDIGPKKNKKPAAISIFIGDVLLTKTISKFEREHGMNDPAGGYGPLVPGWFNYGPLDQHFLGNSSTKSAGKKGDYVLACECGEVGCWPLICEIESADETVAWQNFYQPHRPDRDYADFGPFLFERTAYLKAIECLKRIG